MKTAMYFGRVLSYLICCAFVVSCAHKRPVLALDNHGGISHEGRRVHLHADGSYTETRYTDALGHERRIRGTYLLNAQQTILILSPAHGEPEQLHRTDFKGQQYWVAEHNCDRVKTSAENLFRHVSLRTELPRTPPP